MDRWRRSRREPAAPARGGARWAETGAAALTCALVAGGGFAVGTGALPLRGLDRVDGVGPATLEASRGTLVGDVVNDLDPGFGWFQGGTSEVHSFRYRARAGVVSPGYGTDPGSRLRSRRARSAHTIVD